MTKEQNIEFDKWSEYISQIIRGIKTRTALLLYIKRLISNNTVIILDFTHLSQLLGVKPKVLTKIISNSDSFYYEFRIPKKSGGERIISAPYPVLLQAQKWIYENILIKQPLNENAKGFIRNTSIADNAIEHLNKEYLLKMDVKDFFPSINIRRIISIFKHLGYTNRISYYLAAICCKDNVLPQGAPTSPVLSNIIAKRLDKRLTGLADKFKLAYTRYADDFTFSGNHLPVKFINYCETIVNDEGFKLNPEKTKLLNSKKQKIVTGISVSSGKMTIPKKMKREIRKNIHYVLKSGLIKHQLKIKSKDPIYLERLIGYLHFWRSIEPDNSYIRTSIEKLKQYSLQINN